MVAVGFAVGVLTGLTGVGTGSFTAPVIAYLFGFTANRARGAALTLMLAAASPAVIIYAKAGYMNWPLAGLSALGMVTGAVIGTRLTVGKNQSILRKLVALVLVAAGIHIAMASFAHSGSFDVSLLQGLAVGFGAGLIGGAAGIAGGSLLIPALVILLAVPQKAAQSVALAVIILASLPLAAAYCTGGSADRKFILQLAAGGVLGACVGAVTATGMPMSLLMIVFGVFLTVMATIIFTKISSPGR